MSETDRANSKTFSCISGKPRCMLLTHRLILNSILYGIFLRMFSYIWCHIKTTFKCILVFFLVLGVIFWHITWGTIWQVSVLILSWKIINSYHIGRIYLIMNPAAIATNINRNDNETVSTPTTTFWDSVRAESC